MMSETKTQLWGKTGDICTAIKGRTNLEFFALKRGFRDLGKDLGIFEKSLDVVPEGILSLAVERGIIGKGLDEESKLSRNNPVRVKHEKKKIIDYIQHQSYEEQAFLKFLFSDPNSDTKTNPKLFGIEKINVRRFKTMSNECRVAIIIPARFEEENIKKVLDGYVKQQGTAFNQFEINVIVNHGIDQTPDNTSEVVLQFMRENPNVNVNLLDLQFEPKSANVGSARKLITDVILARAVQRDNYSSSLYIVSEDADVNQVSPRIVKETVERFDRKPKIDFFRGRHQRSEALRSQNHLLSLTYSANQMAEILARDKRLRNPKRKGFNFEWNTVVGGGWASAFTAEGYTLVGGYPANMILGEDMAIPQLLSLARGRKIMGGVIPSMYVSETFPVKEESNYLRLGHELVTGVSAYRTDQFQNLAIKKANESDLLLRLKEFERIKPEDNENVNRFIAALKGALYFLKSCVGNDRDFAERYAPLFFLGIGLKKTDYELSVLDNSIKLNVVNWSNLVFHLDRKKKKLESEFQRRYLVPKGGEV